MATPTDPTMAMSEADPETAKALEQLATGAAKLFMAQHKANPDSPLAEASLSLQRAIAEIARNVGVPSASPDAPAVQGMEMDPNMMGDQLAPEGMGAPEMEAAPMEEPPPTSIEDAAAQTQTMMQAAARKRQGQSY